MEGKVELYRGDELVNFRVYKSQDQLDTIISGWKVLYGRSFMRAKLVIEEKEDVKKEKSHFRKGDIVSKVKTSKGLKPHRSSDQYFRD